MGDRRLRRAQGVHDHPRGASKDVLNEIERNLGDAMNIVRTIMMDPRLVPGGGAIEMTLANKLIEASKVQEPVIANAYKAAGESLEIISRTLLENCGHGYMYFPK